MTPVIGVLVLRCGHISYIVKMNYFCENLLFSLAQIRQFEGIVMMSKEGSAKIVNFMTPGAGVLMIGRGHICHFCEYVVSSTLSIYITLIAIVLRDYDAAFLYHR